MHNIIVSLCLFSVVCRLLHLFLANVFARAIVFCAVSVPTSVRLFRKWFRSVLCAFVCAFYPVSVHISRLNLHIPSIVGR